MTVIQGSIGAIPQRILVADDYEAAARQLLADAGIDSVPLTFRPAHNHAHYSTWVH